MSRLLNVVIAAVLISQTPFDRVLADAAGSTADRANSYDDTWQESWVEHGKSLLASAQGKRPGFVLHIGDSITHARPYSQWAERG